MGLTHALPQTIALLQFQGQMTMALVLYMVLPFWCWLCGWLYGADSMVLNMLLTMLLTVWCLLYGDVYDADSMVLSVSMVLTMWLTMLLTMLLTYVADSMVLIMMLTMVLTGWYMTFYRDCDIFANWQTDSDTNAEESMQEVAHGEQLEVWGLAQGHFDIDFWGSRGSNYESSWAMHCCPYGGDIWVVSCETAGYVWAVFSELFLRLHMIKLCESSLRYILGLASLKDGVFVLFLFCMCLWRLHTVSLVLNNVHEWNSTIFVYSVCVSYYGCGHFRHPSSVSTMHIIDGKSKLIKVAMW